MIAIKQCTDGFVWAILTAEQAKTMVQWKEKEVYRLYDDDSEGLIEDVSEIAPHAEKGGRFGYELNLMKPIGKNKKRIKSFFDDNGHPKKIRCYDNGGESADRFTIVYTGNYRETTGGDFYYLACDSHPCHPMGFGQHGGSDTQIDRPAYSHLGKKIKFSELPQAVQEWVIQDYLEFWGFVPQR